MKNKFKYVIITLLGIILIVSLCTMIDYSRFKNNQKPIFAYPKNYYNDGGSVEYVGLGYVVTYFNMITDSGLEGELKHFGPFWLTFDDAYIETVGEFYAGLSQEEKRFYFEFNDILTEEEMKIILDKDLSVLEYAKKLMTLFEDERISVDNKNWIKEEIKLIIDNNELSEDEKTNFKMFFENNNEE